MAIKDVQLLSIGLDGNPPFQIFIWTDNTAAEVQVTGFLGTGKYLSFPLSNQQMALVSTTDQGVIQLKVHKETNGTFSLVPQFSGEVTLPVVNNDFAQFDGTTGAIKDGGKSASDNTKTKVMMANAAMVVDNFITAADTAGTGKDSGKSASNAAKTKIVMADAATTANLIPKFTDTAGTIGNGYTPSDSAQSIVAMVENETTTGNLAQFADETGTVTDSSIVAERVMTAAFDNPEVGANLVSFDITLTAAALASGPVSLYPSSFSRQYKIRALWVNGGGTNFSGGGGDRLLSITDGTTVYSLIPAASLQTLANTAWGETGLPFPDAAAINTSSAAGQSIRAAYSGGTTNYAAGSVVISGIFERVA